MNIYKIDFSRSYDNHNNVKQSNLKLFIHQIIL